MDIQLILIIAISALAIILAFILGKYMGKLQSRIGMKDTIKEEREDAVKRSRAVLSGQFSEQLAPILPDFPYKPTEVRFVGKPIDFIAFKGIDQGDITEVAFIEVKSGKAQLSPIEKKLKKTIQEKKIKWEEYRT